MDIAIWIELISVSKCGISIGIDIKKSVTICSPNFDSGVKFDLEGQARSITPKNNRDLNQGLLHLLSKFGNPSLNG